MVRNQHYWDRKWSINSFDAPPSIFITSLNHNSYYLFSWVFMKMVHPIIWPYMIWFIFNLGWNIPQLESTFPSLQPLNRWHFKLSTVSSKRMTENHSNLEFEQNGPIITYNGPMVTQNWNKMNQFFVPVIASPLSAELSKDDDFIPHCGSPFDSLTTELISEGSERNWLD